MIIRFIAIFVLFSSCHTTKNQDSTELRKDTSLTIIQNPFLPGYYAEPALIKFESKYYLYATIDPWNSVELAVWESIDFKHWTLRRINWPTKDQCVSQTGGKNLVSAPSVIKAENGLFYMFVTVGNEIWAGVSEHPLGPWYNLHPEKLPIIQNKPNQAIQNIHADCFIDTNKEVYLYWGTSRNWETGECKISRLNKNMDTLYGQTSDITTANFFDSPKIFRRNDSYYMLYATNRTNNSENTIRYARASSPLGPWKVERENILLQSSPDEEIRGPGHPNVYQENGQYYILYHSIKQSANNELLRQLYIDSLNFTSTGTLVPIPSNSPGISMNLPKESKYLDYKVIEASSTFSAMHGMDAVSDKHAGTFWMPALEDSSPYILVDLGETKKILSTYIWVEKVFGVYRYFIEYSKDKKEWKEFADNTVNTVIMAPFSDSKSVKTRYLRITFYLPHKQSTASIVELEIE